jgi:hypothetical protein
MAYPILMRCLWSSTPVIAGIWTSAIKQAVSTKRGDARKSAADEKASTAKPKDLMSLPMDSRKNRSSSTIEINDAFGIRPHSAHVPAIRVLQHCRRACTVSCAKECLQAMPGPVNLGLVWMPIPLFGCQDATEPVSARTSFRRACIVTESESVHPPAGISYEPIVTQSLRTATRAHFRDPRSGVQRCLTQTPPSL